MLERTVLPRAQLACPVSVSPLSCGLPAVERCRESCRPPTRTTSLLHTLPDGQATQTIQPPTAIRHPPTANRQQPAPIAVSSALSASVCPRIGSVGLPGPGAAAIHPPSVHQHPYCTARHCNRSCPPSTTTRQHMLRSSQPSAILPGCHPSPSSLSVF
ncbi:uncharacterized protein EKO05_0001066 [Ascochyta rabiei]|uniref:uncharacterized protein n=1 Tax=Didymella rabiei TaxID=5454 RepID=UPI00220B1067|nr:uncharacterized protein EKO05_0001066 [Ascochyta rabiei]UPX10404.1 hypothetical protein EKO05_0001066 [Ascochyta rabiei]